MINRNIFYCAVPNVQREKLIENNLKSLNHKLIKKMNFDNFNAMDCESKRMEIIYKKIMLASIESDHEKMEKALNELKIFKEGFEKFLALKKQEMSTKSKLWGKKKND